MFIFGIIVGGMIVGAAWVTVTWYKNRKTQIKTKVVDTIKKM
jgi:hypothetical protein